MAYLIGADIGTTSLKIAVFDGEGKLFRAASRDYTLITKNERVEFPAEDYWDMFRDALCEVSEGIEVAALSVDTQCETLILTDSEGKPLCNAIVWLDNRAEKEAREIEEKFGKKLVYETTGQPEICATWPAAKLLWVRKNMPDVWEKTEKIFLLEDYILYKLTGEFVTEKTLQSSSLYFDIRDGNWWSEMLEFIGVSANKLPKICNSGEIVGEYKGIKIVTGVIDQIAGALGAGVTSKNVISEMTGTTMAMFIPCDEIPEYNPDSIIPCHVNYDGKYALLSWTPAAGLALKWFKNGFCEDLSFREMDEIAEKAGVGAEGLIFLPYLCGSTMPRYSPKATGSFLGLTLSHTRAHMARAILESVACMLKSNIDYLGIEAEEIRATGGGASSPLWCRIKADMTGKKITTLENAESACLGSAILAGVAVGIFESVEAAADNIVKTKKTYIPSGEDYTAVYKKFCEAEEKMLWEK
ncbi:MAG: hypothetical protein IJP38_02105 [Oscillospiraceae bacterium]|nr:hypothetical protein [Oscillospiraceae bacterium]